MRGLWTLALDRFFTFWMDCGVASALLNGTFNVAEDIFELFKYANEPLQLRFLSRSRRLLGFCLQLRAPPNWWSRHHRILNLTLSYTEIKKYTPRALSSMEMFERIRNYKYTMKSVAIGWWVCRIASEKLQSCEYHVIFSLCRVVVIISGVSTFIWCKKDIDKRRLAMLKAEQKEKRIKRQLTIGNTARHN